MRYLRLLVIGAVNFTQHMIKDRVWVCALFPFRFWLVFSCQTIVVGVIWQKELALPNTQNATSTAQENLPVSPSEQTEHYSEKQSKLQ